MVVIYGYGGSGSGGLSFGGAIAIAVVGFCVSVFIGIMCLYYRRRKVKLLQQQYKQQNFNSETAYGPGVRPETINVLLVNQETQIHNETNNTAFLYVPPGAPSAPPPAYDASHRDVRLQLAV